MPIRSKQVPSRRSLHRTLVDHGFYLDKYRGGNCSAYVRDHGEGMEEVITLATDPIHPTRLTDKVTVWVGYPENGDEGSTIATTAEEVVAALEFPSQEYTLLGLRIENFLRTKERVIVVPVSVAEEYLMAEYADYLKAQKLPEGSAEDLLRAAALTDQQAEWLIDFRDRWEAMRKKEETREEGVDHPAPTKLTHTADDLPTVVRAFLFSADNEALWLNLPFATLLRAAEQFEREGAPEDGIMVDPVTRLPYISTEEAK